VPNSPSFRGIPGIVRYRHRYDFRGESEPLDFLDRICKELAGKLTSSGVQVTTHSQDCLLHLEAVRDQFFDATGFAIGALAPLDVRRIVGVESFSASGRICLRKAEALNRCAIVRCEGAPG
jgi:hypothetical protein